MVRADSQQSKPNTIRPLEPEELHRAVLTGDRLRNTLNELLLKVPRARRSVLSLARDLGIDRNITQKAVSATAPGVEGADVLSRLPGPDALRMFVAAASSAIGLTAPEPNALAAVGEYEALIRDLAGSQIRLIQRLQGRNRRAGADDDELQAEIRRRLYHDAADLLARSVDVQLLIGIVRPVPDNPSMLHGADAHVLLGLGWDGGSAPFGLASTASEDPGPGGPSRLTDANGLIPEFCSQPLPQITRRTQDGLTWLTIDTPAGNSPRGLDLVFAERWENDPNPAVADDERKRIWSQLLKVARPTRRLMTDVYMHRSMAMSCIPQTAAYSWSPGQEIDPTRNWHERMPGRVRLEVLGPGLRHAGSSAWARHADFTQHLFARSGLDPDEFVGYRCDVAYPIWSATYYMMFDFRSQAS